jgi:hypothetical protein
MIHFADDLPAKTWIKWEVLKFPKFAHDDILDTLCDLMASRNGGITPEVMPAGRPELVRPMQVEVKGPDGSVSIIKAPPAAQQVSHAFLFGDNNESGVDSVTGY